VKTQPFLLAISFFLGVGQQAELSECNGQFKIQISPPRTQKSLDQELDLEIVEY
jgi:hypothetical protein